MQFILFNVFSTLESLGMFCVMLAMFRFRIRTYFIHILFSSILLSNISYFVRTNFQLDTYVPLIYSILIFMFVWLMLRVPSFYALIMTAAGYSVSLILQITHLLIGMIFNLFSLTEAVPFTELAYVVQLLVFLESIFISWILVRQRIGFTFVPFNENQINVSKSNILFLLIVLLSFILISIHLYFSFQGVVSFIVITIFLFIIFSVIIYTSIRREMQDD